VLVISLVRICIVGIPGSQPVRRRRSNLTEPVAIATGIGSVVGSE
jgi:hypothetical protein